MEPACFGIYVCSRRQGNEALSKSKEGPTEWFREGK